MVDLKKHGSSDIDLSPKLVDLEASMDMLSRENEILKKRCEQLLSKEKNAKDEIRDLKAQLLRKCVQQVFDLDYLVLYIF